MNKIRDYFNNKAEAYMLSRTKGILSYLVKKETKKIMEITRPNQNDSILDAGCGSGYYSLLFKRAGAIPFGVDLSPRMTVIAKQNGLNVIVGELETIKLKKKFDKILMAGSLEFSSDYKRVLRNVISHLKPGGIICILFPKKNLCGILYYLFHLRHGIKISLFNSANLKQELLNMSIGIIKTYNVNCLTNIILGIKRKI